MGHNGENPGLTGLTDKGLLRVREVFADNLDEEFRLIRDAVENFPFVAMDTEFPGVFAERALALMCKHTMLSLRGKVLEGGLRRCA
eukprot:1138084-Pelagomonas_calceolata.AAC.4